MKDFITIDNVPFNWEERLHNFANNEMEIV